jgi:hypothetical protein
LHPKGTQVTAFGATQSPVELQVDAGVKTVFWQRAGAHTVPSLYRRQPPAPSHFPSVPQDAAVWSTQVIRGSLPPAGTARQWPGEDDSVQLRHGPQTWSQQTLSMQWLLAHSPAAEHGWPSALGPQLPLTHACPLTQSASLVQTLRHAPSAHRNGEQF